MLYFLIYLSFSIIDLSKIFTGNWNITSSLLTTNGKEIQNNESYFSLILNSNDKENCINGSITEYIKIKNKTSLIFIQLNQISDSNLTFSVKFKKPNDTHDFLEITLLKINIGFDDMMTATGRTSNFSYSLIISPPSYAELTVFHQDTKKVIIYRFYKKIYYRRLNLYHLAPFATTFIYTAFKFLIS